jgi:hypothetical protein
MKTKAFTRALPASPWAGGIPRKAQVQAKVQSANPVVATPAKRWQFKTTLLSGIASLAKSPFLSRTCSLAVVSRSGKRRCYALRIARSVERESGFAKHPNNMFNLARFARWTPKATALGAG